MNITTTRSMSGTTFTVDDFKKLFENSENSDVVRINVSRPDRPGDVQSFSIQVRSTETALR